MRHAPDVRSSSPLLLILCLHDKIHLLISHIDLHQRIYSQYLLPSSSATILPTIVTYNETCSVPSQQVPLNPISIVDIFFPSITSISAAFQQLQTGNTNSYALILCICRIVVFLGKYTYNFLKEFVDSHFSL